VQILRSGGWWYILASRKHAPFSQDRRALVKLKRLPIVAKVPLVFAKTAKPSLRSTRRPSCQLVYEELREDKPARAAQREMPHRKR
jgi:hypothetical protein